MFTPLDYIIIDDPTITTPLQDETLFDQMIIPDFFDRIGYELTYIESEYHKNANIPGHCLVPGSPTDAAAVVQDWMSQTIDHPNIFLDHCHLNTRYAYDGEALQQLKRLSVKHPRLTKLLNIKRKWMADFCVDWIEDGEVFELMHIEHDFHDIYLYKAHILLLEDLVQNIDWEQAYHDLKKLIGNDNYDEYEHAKIKAEYFGLDKLDYLHEPKMLSYKKVY